MKFRNNIPVVIFLLIFVFCMFFKPSLCAIIVGSLVAFTTIKSFLFLFKINKKGIDCTGVIINYHYDSDRQKSPLVEFTTTSGDVIREQPFVYATTDLSKFRSYKQFIDQPVDIIYDPEDPKKFVLRNENAFNYVILILVSFMGLFFVVMGIASLLGYIKMG